MALSLEFPVGSGSRGTDVVLGIVRQLFRGHGHDVRAYSDAELVGALLYACPKLSDFWLSEQHLASTIDRLKQYDKTAR